MRDCHVFVTLRLYHAAIQVSTVVAVIAISHCYPIARSLMTGLRASTSIPLLAACLVFWSALMMQGAQAQNIVSNHHASAGAIHFALPAQPLGDALKVYGNLTQLSVLAQSKLIDNRVSAP